MREPLKQLLTQIGAKKRRGNDACMPFSLIYFFAPISIFYIPHNYVIPQAMPHAIPQTHSAFYPHRNDTWFCFSRRRSDSARSNKFAQSMCVSLQHGGINKRRLLSCQHAISITKISNERQVLLLVN